jgi:hypothetical protein
VTIASESADAAVRDHPAALEYPDRADAAARVRVRHHDRRARTLRAARTLAACWGLAVVAVFLPVLHFVLVPALLLLGPAMAWSRLHETRTLLGVEGACPACALALHLKLAQPWRERTILRCDGCGRRLTLVLPPAAGD